MIVVSVIAIGITTAIAAIHVIALAALIVSGTVTPKMTGTGKIVTGARMALTVMTGSVCDPVPSVIRRNQLTARRQPSIVPIVPPMMTLMLPSERSRSRGLIMKGKGGFLTIRL
ncbi:hypothetical protein QBC38DRAFT_113606 [Podospora fimiseda]|uniref:Uncharacterized protein n=1 Tax=Podospora fimiseda TaxID=252190 RepID=A0AAN7BTD4_9PEZI|nr:hypothetical protein QBC38DRAFT_113606 [Podospora fimiseda]